MLTANRRFHRLIASCYQLVAKIWMTLSRLIGKGTHSRIFVWPRMYWATRAVPGPAPECRFTSCSLGIRQTNRAQKNRFEIRNGGRTTTRKNSGNTRGKIGKTAGGEDLPVLARVAAEQSPALHQRVFGLKHDAKLRNVYAGQTLVMLPFYCVVFFNFCFRCNWLISALFASVVGE